MWYIAAYSKANPILPARYLAALQGASAPVRWDTHSGGLRLTQAEADQWIAAHAADPNWRYQRVQAGFGWTQDYDDEGHPWIESDILGDYQARISRMCATITFLGHPAEDDGLCRWSGLTIVLADSEYLDPPVFQTFRETWDDYASGQMSWCEDILTRYLTAGHTAADITHVYYTYPRGTPTSFWNPLPWACTLHQRRGADAGYAFTQLSHEDELACPVCRQRYDRMRVNDWRLL